MLSVAIIFAFSRAVWIGLLLSVIIFLIFNKALRHPEAPKALKDPAAYRMALKNLPIIPSLGFFILFIFVLFLAREPILARITSSNRLEQRSNQERMLSYKEGVDIIKKNWMLGTGIGNYTLALYKKNPGLSAYDCQPVHNLFMLISSELGIFGLFIFLLFLFYAAKKLITSFKLELTTDSPSSQGLTTGNPMAEKNYFILPSRQSLPEGTLTIKEKNYFIILFIFILLISLFDHYFWSLHFGVILFWLSMGIITAS